MAATDVEEDALTLGDMSAKDSYSTFHNLNSDASSEISEISSPDTEKLLDNHDDLKKVPSSMPNQGVLTEPANPSMLPEDELAGLLLASVGWDDCQLEMLDSLLDSL